MAFSIAILHYIKCVFLFLCVCVCVGSMCGADPLRAPGNGHEATTTDRDSAADVACQGNLNGLHVSKWKVIYSSVWKQVHSQRSRLWVVLSVWEGGGRGRRIQWPSIHLDGARPLGPCSCHVHEWLLQRQEVRSAGEPSWRTSPTTPTHSFKYKFPWVKKKAEINSFPITAINGFTNLVFVSSFLKLYADA